MSKEKEEFQHDWYGILGLEVGSSKEEIERAARKLSVRFHPDKTTDPDAPAKFLLIQKSKEILLDEGKKKIIDDHFMSLKRRQEYESIRSKEMDSKRKKFKDEFEKRLEKEVSKQDVIDPNEVLQREIKKRSSIIEELRKQNTKWMEETTEDILRQENEKRRKIDEYSKFVSKTESDLETEIKVKWRKDGISHSDDSLYFLFKEFGPIEEVKLSESKGNSAYIRFSTHDAAVAAVDKFANSHDFRISLSSGGTRQEKAAIFTHKFRNNSDVNSNKFASSIPKMTIEEDSNQFKRPTNEINLFSLFLSPPISYEALQRKEEKIFNEIFTT